MTPFVLALPHLAAHAFNVRWQSAKWQLRPVRNRRPFIRLSLSLGHCNAINLHGAAERRGGGRTGEDTGNLHALKCNLRAFPGRGLPCNIPLRYATWHRCHTVHSASRRGRERSPKPCHCPCLNGRIEGRLIGSPAATVSLSAVALHLLALIVLHLRLPSSDWPHCGRKMAPVGTSWHASCVL